MPSPLVMRRVVLGAGGLPSGILGRYRASSGLWQDSVRTTAAVADSDPLGAWDDLSGNGHHLLQATSGKRPSLKLTQKNGLPAIAFDGVSSWMQVAYTQPQPVTAFLVISPVMTDGMYIMDGGSSLHMALRMSGSTLLRMYDSATFISGTLPSSPSGWYLVSAQYNDPNSVLAINGITRATGSTGTSAPNGLTVGANGTAGSNPAQFRLCELLLYPSALGASDQQRVLNVLNGIYGVF